MYRVGRAQIGVEVDPVDHYVPQCRAHCLAYRLRSARNTRLATCKRKVVAPLTKLQCRINHSRETSRTAPKADRRRAVSDTIHKPERSTIDLDFRDTAYTCVYISSSRTRNPPQPCSSLYSRDQTYSARSQWSSVSVYVCDGTHLDHARSTIASK